MNSVVFSIVFCVCISLSFLKESVDVDIQIILKIYLMRQYCNVFAVLFGTCFASNWCRNIYIMWQNDAFKFVMGVYWFNESITLLDGQQTVCCNDMLFRCAAKCVAYYTRCSKPCVLGVQFKYTLKSLTKNTHWKRIQHCCMWIHECRTGCALSILLYSYAFSSSTHSLLVIPFLARSIGRRPELMTRKLTLRPIRGSFLFRNIRLWENLRLGSMGDWHPIDPERAKKFNWGISLRNLLSYTHLDWLSCTDPSLKIGFLKSYFFTLAYVGIKTKQTITCNLTNSNQLFSRIWPQPHRKALTINRFLRPPTLL
jgi:hypothetical protein